MNKNYKNHNIGIWSVKDINFKYIYASESFSNLFTKNANINVQGLTDHDLPGPLKHIADTYREYEIALILKKRKIITIDYFPTQNNWMVFLTNRELIFDSESESFHILFNAINISNVKIFRSFSFFSKNVLNNISKNPTSIVLNKEYSPLDVTFQQEKCLFYLIRGKSAKEIAEILNISPRTVERHISLMKERLNCYSKSDLIEKALDNGFFYYIPADVTYY